MVLKQVSEEGVLGKNGYFGGRGGLNKIASRVEYAWGYQVSRGSGLAQQTPVRRAILRLDRNGNYPPLGEGPKSGFMDSNFVETWQLFVGMGSFQNNRPVEGFQATHALR